MEKSAAQTYLCTFNSLLFMNWSHLSFPYFHIANIITKRTNNPKQFGNTSD